MSNSRGTYLVTMLGRQVGRGQSVIVSTAHVQGYLKLGQDMEHLVEARVRAV